MPGNSKSQHERKVIKELRLIFWTSFYFFCWFGGLMVIKVLLLREYQIQFTGFVLVVVGALVVAKVVLVMEYVPMPFLQKKPAWIDVLTRTLLYLLAVFVVMVLEKSFEARHEYDGMITAIKNLSKHSDIYHIWVNILSVFGALLFFNIWTVVKKNFGEGTFLKMMNAPVPKKMDSRTS